MNSPGHIPAQPTPPAPMGAERGPPAQPHHRGWSRGWRALSSCAENKVHYEMAETLELGNAQVVTPSS